MEKQKPLGFHTNYVAFGTHVGCAVFIIPECKTCFIHVDVCKLWRPQRPLRCDALVCPYIGWVTFNVWLLRTTPQFQDPLSCDPAAREVPSTFMRWMDPEERPKSLHMKATMFAPLPLKGQTSRKRKKWKERCVRGRAFSKQWAASPPWAFKHELMRIPGVFHVGRFQDASTHRCGGIS